MLTTNCSSSNDKQYLLCSTSDEAEKAVFLIKPVSGFAALGRGRPPEEEISFSVVSLRVPYDFNPTIGSLERDPEYARQDDTHYWGKAYWATDRRYVDWSINRRTGVLYVSEPSSIFDTAATMAAKERGQSPREKMADKEYVCAAVTRQVASDAIIEMNQMNTNRKNEIRQQNKF